MSFHNIYNICKIFWGAQPHAPTTAPWSGPRPRPQGPSHGPGPGYRALGPGVLYMGVLGPIIIPQTAFAVGVLPEFPGPLTFGTTGSAGELLGVVPHLASICVTLDF